MKAKHKNSLDNLKIEIFFQQLLFQPMSNVLNTLLTSYGVIHGTI